MPDGNGGHIKARGIGHTVHVSKWWKMPLSDWLEPAGCSELYESQMMHYFSRARREGTGRSHCKNSRLPMTHAGRHRAVRSIRPLWASQQPPFISISIPLTRDIQNTVSVNMHFLLKRKKQAVCLFTPSCMMACRAADAPSHLMSVCKMSAWSSALARFPQEYALILCYGFCCSSMWRETH